ncbi:MAG: hypothetical protein IJ130_04160 [Solobacterium sp.]|nr:hypothetical protein [Solobacterium sp.]MBQ9152987.1 hypothetical protein [Solobacterium sp.]
MMNLGKAVLTLRTPRLQSSGAVSVKNADRIVVLGRNGIEEEGTHDELLAKQGIYYRLWNGPGRDE